MKSYIVLSKQGLERIGGLEKAREMFPHFQIVVDRPLRKKTPFLKAGIKKRLERIIKLP